MKKSFFLSILAVGALVACSKSEVVDTKFDQAISFENYLGRAAQTKAAVATTVETAGIYGFYTAANQWDYDDSKNGAEGYVTAPVANLWSNNVLTGSSGSVDTPKYWTNESDYYSFVAYAPYGNSGFTTVPTGDAVANPAVTYTVPTDLATQVDVLYANALNVKKPTTDGGKIDMIFKHALARLTVKAAVAETDAETFAFRVKKITLNGGFITSDALNLATGLWAKAGVPVEPTTAGTETTNPEYATTYTFVDTPDNETALTKDGIDYSGTTTSGETKTYGNNYLMMIPVNFSAEGDAAYLTVEYTTYYQNTESTVNKVVFPVSTNFEKGKAYSINLAFSKDAEDIAFNVTVENWDETPENNSPQKEDIEA